MGMTAAIKLTQIVRNVEAILAIELLAAAQGLEFLKPLRPGPRIIAAYEKVRRLVPALDHDVQLSGYLAALIPVVRELHRV
jgi:histidine ammonia-lyase